MIEIKRKINGVSWTFKVVTAKQMQKQREKDQPIAGGLCVPSERTIYLDDECVDYTTVTHELVHAYVSDLHLSDTNNLQLDDIEEIFASLFTAKGEKIIRQGKNIVKDLQKKMEK